ncbi:MAG: peptidyl-prolyl cis-trans isomerase [Candidatus Omnitrophica bacterium]|nr:peptidyl-prolyl cis-trans isomerase [Candidatus Omnitrophota bacterium]
MKSHEARRHISWIIAAVLILPFIFYFHATGRAPLKGPGGTAGTIFGKPVPWDTFQQQRIWLQRQWENQFGRLPESFQPLLIQSTWDRLILSEEARRTHLQVDDRELVDVIRKIPAFQDHGRFVAQRYKQYLKAINTNSQAFEAFLRQDLLVEKLVDTIKQTVVVTDADVKRAYHDAHDTLRATLIIFDTATYIQEVATTLTDAELRAYYDAHPDEFRIPDQLTFTYAGASRDDLAGKVELTDDDLNAFYEDHEKEFTTPDGKVKTFEEAKDGVRQRLMAERVRKQLTALSLDLQEDLEAKKTFDEMVTARALISHTAGPVAANSPWVSGGPEPQILQAASQLAKGTTSDVVETDGGVYLVRLTDRVPSRLPAFEDVRATIAGTLTQERSRAKAKEAADAFHAKAKEQSPTGLRYEEVALFDHTLHVTPATFTLQQPIDPIGRVPELNQAAFATPLGHLTAVVEFPNGFAMLRPEERTIANEEDDAKEETKLRQDLLTKKQNEHLEQWIGQMRARARLQDFSQHHASES